MNKDLREVTKLISYQQKNMQKIEKLMKGNSLYKKDRRVGTINFYFDYETMKTQIQEMLHIEKGGDEQLKDELAAYNPLIPKERIGSYINV